MCGDYVCWNFWDNECISVLKRKVNDLQNILFQKWIQILPLSQLNLQRLESFVYSLTNVFYVALVFNIIFSFFLLAFSCY